LEDVEMLGRPAEMRDALDAGRAGADDADPLVLETGQIPVRIAAGVIIVPAAGVEAVAFEAVDPGDAGHLGIAEQAGAGDQVAGSDLVAAVRPDDPALPLTVPVGAFDRGLEQRVTLEIIVAGDRLGMGE